MSDANLSEAEELELLLLQKQKAIAEANMNSPMVFLKNEGQGIAEKAGQAVMASSPANLTKQFFQTDPATMQRVGGAALPIAGGMVGGPIGAAAGEFARQATGAAFAPDTVPETPLGRAASVMGAGVAENPAMLKAIPGVPKVLEMTGKLASKVKGGLAKGAEVFSGGKAKDFEETARKGLAMYKAPSTQEAGAAMGKVIDKLPGKSLAPTMAERIQTAVSPEASTANKYLVDLGKRIDAGELPTARQALKAKQSLDDIIDTVPIWQRKRRAELFDLKRSFDEVLSNQSGALKQTSNNYRAAVLKDNMTKFLPVNKHGEYSRLAGMLSTLGGSMGAAVGGHEQGVKGGIIGGLAPLATAVALSPGSLGGAAALGGSAARELNSIASNPQARQALLQILQRIRQNRKTGKE